MGTTLAEMLPSFLDELGSMTKIGAPITPGAVAGLAQKAVVHPLGALGSWVRRGIGSVVSGPGGFKEVGRRLDPVLEGRIGYPLSEGWKQMSSRATLSHRVPVTIKGPELEHLKTLSSEIPRDMKKVQIQLPKLERIRRSVEQARAAGKNPLFSEGGSAHLLEHTDMPVPMADILKGKTEGKNRIQAAAEELSRRGWTGEGRVTKYLPVGGKGMLAGMTLGLDAPQVLSNEPGPEGEGRVGKLMGAAGSLGGMMAGGGLGFLPQAALWYAGSKGGSMLGRSLERLGSPQGPSFTPNLADPNLFSGSDQ